MTSSDAIKHTDIAEDGFIRDHAQKELEDFADKIPLLQTALQNLAKTISSNPIFTGNVEIKSIDDLKKYNEAIEKTNKLNIESEKLAKLKAQTEASLSAARKAKINEDKAQIDLNNKKEKQYNNEIKQQRDIESAYKKLSQQLNAQKREVKDLLASKKELSDEDKELIKNTQELDKKLKEIDGTVGDNQRNVGAYKEALNDASAELGAFGGGLSKIIHSLKELREQNEKATSGVQKLGNGLKLVGAAAVLVAVMALVKGFELIKEQSGQLADTFELSMANLNNFFVNLIQGNLNIKDSEKATTEWIKALQESRIATRQLSLELAHVSTLLEKQNQIANDSTIGYKERIAAQKKSIELEENIADKQLKRAQDEFNVIQKEVTAERIRLQGGRANNELLEKEAESIKKLDEAMASQSLGKQEAATKRRALAQAESDELIDLTLKNKETAHARQTILEEEIKDKESYIIERRNEAAELAKINKQSLDDELGLFKKGRDVEFNANELLHEQNEVLLADKLKAIKTNEGHGLDDAGITTLSKIIKKAQEEEISNEKILLELGAEEIKNNEKIASIKRDINIINLTSLKEQTENSLKIVTERYDELTKKLLEVQNIWDFHMQKIREVSFNGIKKNLDAELAYQKSILVEKEKDAEIKANDAITDTKVLNEEILKLQTQLDADLQKVQDDYDNKQRIAAKKKADEDKKLRNERIAAEFNVLDQINKGVAEGLQKRADLNQQADQKAIDLATRTQDIQAQLAAGGRNNSLAEAEAAQQKAEEKKLQDAKKAAKVQQTIAIVETFEKTLSQALQSDKPFPQAFATALASSGIVTAAFSKLFAGYYYGTEDTGTAENPIDNKGGRMAILHDNERVVPKSLNEKLGGISNEDLVKNALAFENIYVPNYNSTNTATPLMLESKHDERLAQLMDKRLQSLEKAINNKPAQQNNLGRLGEWTEQIQRDNITTIINYKKNTQAPSLRLRG